MVVHSHARMKSENTNKTKVSHNKSDCLALGPVASPICEKKKSISYVTIYDFYRSHVCT